MAGQPSIAHSEGPAPAGSPRLGAKIDAARLAAHFDLVALAVALAVFAVAGLSMLGYAVAAAAWLGARAIRLAADRRAAGALARGDRRSALASIAAATLGRVWLITLAVLLVGIADRESGLAAAILSVVLFTVYWGGQGLAHVFREEGAR